MAHFHKLKSFIGVTLLLLLSVAANAQLNGTYTVGGTTPNYPTLTDAVTDLLANGVSGPVTFNLRNGTYSGAQYSITPITGASATNRVVFQSETGVAANVTVSYQGSGSGDNYIFQLDGASYVTIKDLTLTNSATADYAGAVQLLGSATGNIITNCDINTSITGSTSTEAALIYADGFLGADNEFVGNTFTNGSYGIYIYGSSSSDLWSNTSIVNNTFTDQSYHGVYSVYGSDVNISTNTFSTTTYEYTGIYCSNTEGVIAIHDNNIDVNTDDAASAYGINVQDCYGTSGDPVSIEHNTVNVTNISDGPTYGIYTYGVEYNSVVNNTITTAAINGTNSPLYNSSSPNSNITQNTVTSTVDWGNTEIATLDNCPDSYFGENTLTVTGGQDGNINLRGITSGADNSTIYKNTFDITGTSTWQSIENVMSQDASNSIVRKNTVNITSEYQLENYVNYFTSDAIADSNSFTFTDNYTDWDGPMENYMGYGSSNGLIDNNTIQAVGPSRIFALDAEGADGATISNNTINSEMIQNFNWEIYGLRVPYSNNVKVNSNHVFVKCLNTTWPSVYGLYAEEAESIEVTNNSITSIAPNNGNGYGFYIPGNRNGKFLHNSAHSQGSNGYVVYAANWSPDADFINTVLYNNVFLGTGSAFAFVPGNGNKYTSDYNLFYSPSNVFLNANMGTGLNLTNFRAQTGNDKNSLQFNALIAWPNRATGDLTPDAAAPEVWAINGRGIHDAAVPTDIANVTRPATKPDGVPDLGAYEVLPTSIPPDASPSPAIPATGMQYFTFGLDTVASIDWTSATVPASITVKQYSGEAPTAFSFPFYTYFHTDIDVPAGSYPHTANIYYKEPWGGTTAAESGLRLVKKLGTGSWTPFSAPASNTDPARNMISTTGLTDFGIHTASDVANNASVNRLTSPTPTFCAPSTQTIKIIVKNTGNNILNSVKIDWFMNGGFMGTVDYTTPINTSLVQPDEAEVTLGTYTFTNSRPVKFRAFTHDPNGVQDSAPMDDELNVVITPGLNGEYTVGGTTPDFVDVKEAIDILNKWGVCGPTVFKIRDDVNAYQGAGVINAPIIGGSTINRVTFRSESGNAANVVIQGITPDPVFGLDNVTDVSIKNIKIVGIGNVGISMAGEPQRDTIRGCIIAMPATTNWDSYNACISGMNSDYMGYDNALIKNTLTGTAAGISLQSQDFYDAYNNVIDSNDFSNHLVWGLTTQSLKSSKIRGNTATNIDNPFDIFQTGTYDTDPIEIIGNVVNNNVPGRYMGVSLGNGVFGTFDTRAKIAFNKINATCSGMDNNMLNGLEYTDVYSNDVRATLQDGIAFENQWNDMSNSNVYNNTVQASFSSSGTGFMMRQGRYSDNKIYNNTIVVSGSASDKDAADIELSSSTSNNEIYNNIFNNTSGTGNGLYWNNSGSDNRSDFNNIYSANGNHFSNNGTPESSLNEWRISQLQELNSISYDPGLTGMGDLHPNPANAASWSLNGRAIHLPDNNFDRDGNARETDLTLGVPDIGAYEFEPTTVPPLADATPALPVAGSTQVFTFGQDTVATLVWNPMTVVSNTIEVRQYSGRQGPSYPAGLNHMYFYTDVLTQNVSADYTANVYYKDHWMGTVGSEADLRLLKKLNPNPWVAYNQILSEADVDRNIITAPHVTSTGLMTGVEDGSLFSAVITPKSSTTFCTGGSTILEANGGVGYTYKWYRNGTLLPGATNQTYVALVAGNYSVQVTNPNAIPSATTATSVEVGVSVIAPPSALISASGPLTYCTGGQLTLMANTGIDLWYQWQFNGNNIPSANNDELNITSAGNYTVTVSNIGCATTSTITTINQGPLHVTLGEDTSFCASQVLVLDAGYPGAHYLWSNGDTTQKIYITTASGDYSVLVDAGINCQARDTINVHIDPLPSLIGISYLGMGGSTFQFAPSGAQDVNSYMWMYSDGTVDFNQNTTHTFPANADWIATLIVFNDCGTDTSVLDLRALSVANVQNDASFSLYPNPASDKVTLSSDKVKLSDVVIINNLGQVVYRGKEDNVKSTTIDITGMVDGHYIIRANTSDGKIISKPFDVLK
jgi:hypothetical protein